MQSNFGFVDAWSLCLEEGRSDGMAAPRVSVIMAVRDPGRYLQDAIASVVNQTFHDWELIVVDDGSREDISGEIQCPNAKLIRQPPLGVSAARNLGITHSSGEFISFLDGDDVWFPDKLKKQVFIMNSDPAIGLCHTERNVIDSDGQILFAADMPPSSGTTSRSRQIAFSPPDTEPIPSSIYEPPTPDGLREGLDLIGHTCVTTSTAMIRRECLPVTGLFDVMLQYSEDYDMWIKLSRFYKVAHILSCEASYRWHGENVMARYSAARFYDREMLLKYERFARGRQDRATAELIARLIRGANKQYAPRAFDQCRQAFREGRFWHFLYHLSCAVRLDPVFVGASLKRWLSTNTQTSDNR